MPGIPSRSIRSWYVSSPYVLPDRIDAIEPIQFADQRKNYVHGSMRALRLPRQQRRFAHINYANCSEGSKVFSCFYSVISFGLFSCCFYLWSTCTILFDMCSLNGKNASVNRFTKMVVKSRTSHRSTKWSHGSLFFTHAKNIELKSKTLAAVASLNWSYTSFKPSRIKGDAAGSLHFMWVIKVIGVIGVRSRSKLHRSMVGHD